MCLTTRFPFIKTKKPIFCYKVTRKKYISMYQEFPYELNKLYVLDSNLEAEFGFIDMKNVVPECLWKPGGCYYGRKGLESAINNFKYLKVISRGFHAYRDIEKAIKFANSCDEFPVVKCVIPEGSIICINYDEIVSNQIIIIGQVY